MKGSIRGLQQAQAAANQAAAAVTAGGALGRAVKHVTARVHRYATTINPVDTGSWRGSQRQTIEQGGLVGHVFLQPGATNSRTGTPVSRYAGMYEARKGRYAVYLRTFEEDGQKALDEGGAIARGALP
jgi:hypothetical protein